MKEKRLPEGEDPEAIVLNEKADIKQEIKDHLAHDLGAQIRPGYEVAKEKDADPIAKIPDELPAEE